MHTHAYTFIRAYTCTHKHHQIAVWRCFQGVTADAPRLLGGVTPTSSPVMGHETGSKSADRTGGASLWNWRGASGALDACGRGYVCQTESAKVLPMAEKSERSDAPGSLEWGRLAAALRDCVFGEWHRSSHGRSHSRKYMHIHLYMHIHTNILTYTNIRTYTFIHYLA